MIYFKVAKKQDLKCSYHKKEMIIIRDFPGGPAVKTPCSQCRGPGFDPWPGN